MSISIPGADYTPQLAGYTGQGAFRFWCQKVLPIVYDDSLSYYELLNKVVVYLNNVIKDVATLEDNVGALDASFVSLQEYVNLHFSELVETYNTLEQFVNDYFDNLDVQDEINNKLDQMASNGELANIIAPTVEYLVPGLITEWLNSHITPTSPAIDKSLSVTDAGADSKVTGDIIKNELSVYGNLTSVLLYDIFPRGGITEGKYKDYRDGHEVNATDYCFSDYIPVIPGRKYCLVGTTGNVHSCYYTANKTYNSGTINTTEIFTIPADCYYMVVSPRISDLPNFRVYMTDTVPDNGGGINESAVIERLENESATLSVMKDEDGQYGGLSVKALRIDIMPRNGWVTGKYINYTNGAESVNENTFYTPYIPVIPGETYIHNFGNNTHTCFYDENKKFISGILSEPRVGFTVPSNCYYMIVSPLISNTDLLRIFMGDSFPVRLGEQNKSQIATELERTKSSIDLTLHEDKAYGGSSAKALMVDIMPRTDWTMGKYINYNTGVESAADTYFHTSYIPVLSGEQYIANFGSNTHTCFYDENYNYVSGVLMEPRTPITVPSGCYYMIVSPLNANTNLYRIYMASSFPAVIGGIGKSALVDGMAQAKLTGDEVMLYGGRVSEKLVVDLFPRYGWTMGKYLNYNTGLESTAATYFYTPKIPVIPGYPYVFNAKTAATHTCFYDKDGNYVSGILWEQDTSITIPANCYYMVLSPLNSNVNDYRLYLGQQFPAVVGPIGGSKIVEEMISKVSNIHATPSNLIQLLKQYNGSGATIVLESGTYNLFDMYKAFYGNSFWTDYDGYGGVADKFYRGLWVEDVSLVGSGGTVITYSGDKTTAIMRDFALIAPCGNVTIGDMTLDIGFRNIRYAIHDDFTSNRTPTSNITYRNILLRGTGVSNGLIGGGCGTGCVYTVDNCVFEDNSAEYDMFYHNYVTPDVPNKITVSNCYGLKKCTFKPYGTLTTMSVCVVNNSKFLAITKEPVNESAADNMRIIKYLCEEG